jgi:nicotinamidase-related amidase
MKCKLSLNTGIIIFFLSSCLGGSKTFCQDKYLMVLDIQKFDKKNKQQEDSVKKMILNVNSLISHFPPEKVIYIKAAGKALNITSKGLTVVVLPAPDFDSSLQVVSKNIFIKTEGDAFTSSALIGFLESKKVKEIVLVGLMADKCLYNTALGGKERGYNIMVIPEGIVGRTPKKKEKAIKKLKAEGIDLKPLKEIIPIK